QFSFGAGSYPSGQVVFKPLALGQTDIAFSSDRALSPTPDHLTLSVVSPISADLSQYTVPAGFQFSPYLNFGIPANKVPITITSGDPASLVVAPDQNTPGSASVVVNYSTASGGAAFQALAPGAQVPITISAPGFPPFSTTIRTDNPVATFRFGSNNGTDNL